MPTDSLPHTEAKKRAIFRFDGSEKAKILGKSRAARAAAAMKAIEVHENQDLTPDIGKSVKTLPK